MVGKRATAFAEHIGEKIVETSALVTEKAKRRLESMPDFQPSLMQDFYRKRLMMTIKTLSKNKSGMNIINHSRNILDSIKMQRTLINRMITILY